MNGSKVRTTTLILGALAAGWIGRGMVKQEHSSTTDPLAKSSTVLLTPSQERNGNQPSDLSDTILTARAIVARQNEKLSDKEFAKKLVSLIRDGKTFEQVIETESMKNLLTPGRFAEFYVEYLSNFKVHQDSTELNDLLTKVGQEHGWPALEALLEKYPDGFERWDSMIHGWAMKDPQGATDWFNELSDTMPRHDRALNGLIWGLAAKDGVFAGNVMEALSEDDRNAAIHSFALSFVESHGLDALDSWRATAEEKLARDALFHSIDAASQKAPAEAVKWFTTHVGELGIRGELLGAFNQWLAAAPDEANHWLSALPRQDDPRISQLHSRLEQLAASHSGSQ